MLVLTRKLGESIVINEDIKITFLEMKGKQLRIGIEAPPEISVYRGEIYQMIKEQNIEAASLALKEGKGIRELWQKIKKGEQP